MKYIIGILIAIQMILIYYSIMQLAKYDDLFWVYLVVFNLCMIAVNLKTLISMSQRGQL
jgi:hypothetical protein